MDALEIVRRAACPAIATDDSDRILAWNRAARELLGYPGRFAAEGEGFHDLLAARDIFGNHIHRGALSFYEMVIHGEAPRSFELEARKSSGEYVRIAVSVVVVLGPGPEHYRLVYFPRRILRRRQADEVIERALAHPDVASLFFRGYLDDSSPAGESLTRRQREVLRLLAQGKTAGQIATSLSVSVNTVRRHVQNILGRLKVHSKAEAVSRAFRDRLV